MTLKIEKKFQALDLKAAAESGVIEGYASVFGIEDNGGDVVMAGAFANSLKGRSGAGVKMLWQHNPDQPIGVWDEIREDEKGLWIKGRLLTEVQKGKEAAVLMAAGAIEGLSIGYRTLRSKNGDGSQRILEEVELWEVSVVTFPMLPEATAALKGADLEDVKAKLEAGDQLSKREFEKWAKGLGLSNSQAERAARVHLKGQGEPDKADSEVLEFLRIMKG